ncbi:DUF3073 domain-containing protein [Streptomyces sp. DT24]|uniref:DUF3073 domain-containing protein n=1 Tax=unclassified Streptomyces TaxID=2593676 RepID=UPI0023BA35C7|nr:DUF3073 domain-containing protein [Streptomyces sp. AM 4-1-1]WEH35125.1 DUF3073 domain-containing protein [Streptomyces sp. AM 4-1-1]
MGRGRARAKQAKVARELKYSTSVTDFEALQRELAGGSTVRNKDPEPDQEFPEYQPFERSYREE